MDIYIQCDAHYAHTHRRKQSHSRLWSSKKETALTHAHSHTHTHTHTPHTYTSNTHTHKLLTSVVQEVEAILNSQRWKKRATEKI